MGSNENRRNPAWYNQIEKTQTHISKNYIPTKYRLKYIKVWLSCFMLVLVKGD